MLPNTDLTAQYVLPSGSIVAVKNGAEIQVGDVLGRIPQASSKTRDITGGLPRVADLFEARKTKDPAILAEATGAVSFGKETKGKQRVIITDSEGEQYETLVPKWRHITVFEGEVQAQNLSTARTQQLLRQPDEHADPN
jgi:DNA-directed RNA polymerase subunit beta'